MVVSTRAAPSPTRPAAFPPAADATEAVDELRREPGQVEGGRRKRLREREREIALAHLPRLGHRSQEPVALGLQKLSVLAGMGGRRGVGQHREGRRLGPGERSRRAAEKAEARCLDADDVAAERSVLGIQPEDAAFALEKFEPDCHQRLERFLADSPLRAGPAEPCDLHADRRSAGDDLAGPGVLKYCSRQGDRIDPGVGEEALVLVGGKGLDEARRDGLSGRQPPLPRLGHRSAQQLAAPRVYGNREAARKARGWYRPRGMPAPAPPPKPGGARGRDAPTRSGPPTRRGAAPPR